MIGLGKRVRCYTQIPEHDSFKIIYSKVEFSIGKKEVNQPLRAIAQMLKFGG